MLVQEIIMVRPLIPFARWLFEMNQRHISRDRYLGHEVALAELSFCDRRFYEAEGKRGYDGRVWRKPTR